MIYDISTCYQIHQSIRSHVKLNISDSTSTVSLSSHPDYRSYNPHYMYDYTGTICITSCEYLWHHIHSLWYHTMLWHSHTLYSCDHTQDTCHGIHCSWAITYSLLIIAHLQYVWSQTTIYMTSYEFNVRSQHSFWYHKSVFMTSHPHYSWIQTHWIRHDIHYTFDITATLTRTRHLLCFWHYTQCIWHLTWWMNDNTTTVSDMIPKVSV